MHRPPSSRPAAGLFSCVIVYNRSLTLISTSTASVHEHDPVLG